MRQDDWPNWNQQLTSDNKNEITICLKKKKCELVKENKNCYKFIAKLRKTREIRMSMIIVV